MNPAEALILLGGTSSASGSGGGIPANAILDRSGLEIVGRDGTDILTR